MLLTGVKKLVCSGAGRFSVTADGAITCANVTLTQSGDTLTCKGKGGGGGIVMSIGSGNSNVVIMGTNHGIAQVNGGGKRSRGSSISTISIGDGKTISIAGGQIFIDGKLAKTDDSAPAPVAAPTTYRLAPDTQIEKISVDGPFTVSPIPPAFLALSSFEAVLKGSGDIFLPTDCEFEQLSIMVTGSGNVSGGTAVHATIMLTGSGDVSKLHVRKSGSVMLNGSGDVNITREATAKVKKMVNGSGDVRIRAV